jgi:hypothetical protein
MARQYPIWNDVSACKYKTSKSYGAVDTNDFTQYVGSSSRNSHEQCRFITSKRKHGEYWHFKTSLNGVILIDTVFTDNNGKPGNMVKQIDHTKRLKGL